MPQIFFHDSPIRYAQGRLFTIHHSPFTMKTIGMIGGTSWVSTVDYYRYINELVNEKLGGLNYARIYLHSVNFEEFRPQGTAEDWIRVGKMLSGIAQNLEKAGAECMMLCANTPHKVADEVASSISIPLIHIGEATAGEASRRGYKNVLLLGTRFTMEDDFISSKFHAKNLNTVIPSDRDRAFVHRTIFNELGKGIFKEETKNGYIDIIQKMKAAGADAVAFACTEIPMLIKESESPLPVLDTTYIHAKAVVDFALSEA
jgi:aspartate racemase